MKFTKTLSIPSLIAALLTVCPYTVAKADTVPLAHSLQCDGPGLDYAKLDIETTSAGYKVTAGYTTH